MRIIRTLTLAFVAVIAATAADAQYVRHPGAHPVVIAHPVQVIRPVGQPQVRYVQRIVPQWHRAQHRNRQAPQRIYNVPSPQPPSPQQMRLAQANRPVFQSALSAWSQGAFRSVDVSAFSARFSLVKFYQEAQNSDGFFDLSIANSNAATGLIEVRADAFSPIAADLVSGNPQRVGAALSALERFAHQQSLL